MGTKNTLVKKLVLELFSAVSVYSSYGHKAALDALDYFKVSVMLFAIKFWTSKVNCHVDVKNENVPMRHFGIGDNCSRLD